MKNGRYVNVRNIVESKKQESENHNSDFVSYKSQPLKTRKILKISAKLKTKIKVRKFRHSLRVLISTPLVNKTSSLISLIL